MNTKNLPRFTFKLFAYMLVIMLLINALISCGPVTPVVKTPTPTPLPDPRISGEPSVIIEQNDIGIDINYKKNPKENYVIDEIIIIGPDQKTIDDLIANEPELKEQLELLSTIKLSLPDSKLPEEVILLYRIRQPAAVAAAHLAAPTRQATSVPEIVDLINNTKGNSSVRANPDYLIYNPWSIGGGPWGPANGFNISPQLFWDQWALSETDGIGLYPTPNPSAARTRNTKFTGKQINVGVFDTSPFSFPSSLGNQGGRVQFTGWSDPKLYPDFTLFVSHPRPLASSSTGSTSASNHGLFVAGLVHAVAPDSSIYLIRTLDDAGEGTLFGLLLDMQAFIRQQSALGDISGKTVINLSLGVKPGSASERPVPATDKESLPCLASQQAQAIPSLSCYFDWLNRSGVVVVASAGNDSANGVQQPSEYPASHPSVIGVAASNKAGGNSCFSNSGDITAPGGDGGPDPTGTPGVPCVPQLSQCPAEYAASRDCEYGLVSLTINPNGFAWWTGTSFSAPLVSGLAALALQSGQLPQDVQDNLLAQNTGVVNLSGTLATPTPTPTP